MSCYNHHINNCLDYLVPDLMELPYLKVALVVFACRDMHLVEPFYFPDHKKDAIHFPNLNFYCRLKCSSSFHVIVTE